MRLSFAALLAILPLAATADDETVRLKRADGTIDVTIGGEPFATYHYKGFGKPFLADLRAPGGTVVTRPIEQQAGGSADHPHHKGLWASVDEINEHRHWMEAQPIRIEKAQIMRAEGNPAEFRVVNIWLDENHEPLMNETTTIRIYADRLVAYDMTLSPAGGEPLTFDDTKEGFFAIRLRDELREKDGTGKITNAHGAKGEKEAWGQTAPWVDYSGTVDGKPMGVAIFDHPKNFRPSRYHVRAYGLFAVNPFGESDYTNGKNEPQPVTLEPGEKLRLRYAAFIHAGDTDSADVAGRFEKYVADSNRK